jgi:hypothetical protein
VVEVIRLSRHLLLSLALWPPTEATEMGAPIARPSGHWGNRRIGTVTIIVNNRQLSNATAVRRQQAVAEAETVIIIAHHGTDFRASRQLCRRISIEQQTITNRNPTTITPPATTAKSHHRKNSCCVATTTVTKGVTSQICSYLRRST